MLVSLFTDASMCGKTGAAGWGAWAKSDRRSTSVGGPLPFPVASSGEAELLAIVRGLRMAAERGVILADARDFVLIQSDNMEALGIVNGSQEPRGRTKMEAWAEFRDVALNHGVTWSTRHVKGHSGNGTPRTAVNELCDKLARKGMMEMRAKLTGITWPRSLDAAMDAQKARVIAGDFGDDAVEVFRSVQTTRE